MTHPRAHKISPSTEQPFQIPKPDLDFKPLDESIVKAALGLTDPEPDIDPEPEPAPAPLMRGTGNKVQYDDDDEGRTELRITYANQIKPKKMRWLWSHDGAGVIPLGTGTIAAGAGGEGKSTFMLDIGAQLTRGTLQGDLHGEKHPVIVFGPEDDWATVMVPRLMAADADLGMVAQVQAATVTDTFTRERELKFPLDVGLLRQAVQQTGAKMILVDPAPSMMSGDMNRVQEVRRSYEPLMSMAQDLDLAVVLINHFGKGAGSVSAKLSGSHAWRDLVRSYLAFATDGDTEERVITQDKSNYGTSLSSWKFILDSTDVAVDGGTTSVAKVRFLGESDVTVSDIINRGFDEGHEGDDDDRNAAQAFILDFLKQKDGWEAKAGEVIKAGLAEGFSKDEMKNARKRCKDPKVQSAKATFGAGWLWQIASEDEVTDAQGVTKVSKVSAHGDMTPSTPSGQKVTPSGISCQLHKTDYMNGCFTCDQITSERTA